MQVSSSLLEFICNYIAIFSVLYVLALVPVYSLQKALDQSWVASAMILYSLILTRSFTHLLLVAV